MNSTESAANGARGGWSAAGAILSVLLASSCCLPLAPFAFAAGAAGLSTLFAGLRPWLMGLSAALLALGFWQAYGRRSCASRPAWWQRVLLWGSLPVIVLFFFFPQHVAGWLAGGAP